MFQQTGQGNPGVLQILLPPSPLCLLPNDAGRIGLTILAEKVRELI